MHNTDPRITVPALLSRKSVPSQKISAITAYDFLNARIFDQSGIDVILVGDSLGTVFQGQGTTLPVTLDQMVYHCTSVTRGASRALVVGDMPFMSYQSSIRKAIESAGRLMKEGGVAAVKLEGGVHLEKTIARIVNMDIPVMGHVGLTPQSYHRMGGYKIQGKMHSGENQVGSWERILDDARAVERAGAFSIVLEGIPSELSKEITKELSIPTIGIGAGPNCDGQILVSTDLLGMNPEFQPRFVKRYANLSESIQEAVKKYAEEVRGGVFPSSDHSFSIGHNDFRKVSRLKMARR